MHLGNHEQPKFDSSYDWRRAFLDTKLGQHSVELLTRLVRRISLVVADPQQKAFKMTHYLCKLLDKIELWFDNHLERQILRHLYGE